jgi:hypothetical protein
MDAMGIRVLTMVMLTAVLPACTWIRGESPLRAELPGETVYGTNVALGPCAFTSGIEGAFFAPIAGALAASAIAEGVNRIGAALKSAGETKTWTARGARNVEVTSKTFGPCIHVVRGWFYRDGGDVAKRRAAAPWLGKTKDGVDVGRYDKLWSIGLWLAQPPDFVFEGTLDRSEDGQAFTVRPLYVLLNEPIATRLLRPGRKRQVAVFLAFPAPGESAEGEKTPSASLVIGLLEPEIVRRYPKLPVAHVNRTPFESNWFALKVGAEQEPLTTAAIVSETQGGSEFLAFVGAVFSGASQKITEELQTALIPEKARAAKETARTAKENTATAFEAKWLAAGDALTKCEGMPQNAPVTAVETRKAMREVNQARRAQGEKSVFSEDEIAKVAATLSADELAKLCTGARVNLNAAAPKP